MVERPLAFYSPRREREREEAGQVCQKRAEHALHFARLEAARLC